MKKLTNFLIFALMAVTCVLVACDGNKPELKNQPLNKNGEINKYWTPEGHTYISEHDNDIEAFRFDDGEGMQFYSKFKDLSEPYEECVFSFEGMYPNFTIKESISENTYTCTFNDTLTCTINTRTYKLYR